MIQESQVILALWVMLPAYIPNNAAALGGGGVPIDAGRTWHGRRLLGDGKTWRGLIAGLSGGLIAAGVANTLLRPVVAHMVGVTVPAIPFPVAAALASGAMLGDIGASFVKRRANRPRGAPAPLIDQLDFVVGAVGVAVLVAPRWILSTVTPAVAFVILTGTPLLHIGANGVAYMVGIKNEPW